MSTATTDSTNTDTVPSRVTSTPAVTGERPTLLGGWRANHAADLGSHLAHHGPLPLPQRGDTTWPERFAAAIEASGLTGRGGASFPSSRKLRLIRSARGRATLVVNAMEGEPASSKDEILLSCVPHLVLDGAQLAARALGATRIVVCVGVDRPESAAAVIRAVGERVGTAFAPLPVEIMHPPGRYVAGEESALVSWLDGGPGAPSWRPDKGTPLTIGRSATLVHNAETLAHMSLIARYGPNSFRSVGMTDAPGTALVTISGGVEQPGVYEVVMGTPLQKIISQARPSNQVAAVLTGGFGGAWVPPAALGAPYAPEPLAAVGGVVGAGVLVVLTEPSCGIAETARIAKYMAGESAGQCGPCVFGLPAVAHDLERLTLGDVDSGAVARLERRVASIDGRGACRHPDGVARLVRSALSVFASDAAAHGAGRPCVVRNQPSQLGRPHSR
jgi:NADH:ubiquinone oxidoreductase subunit F (NADH-binding)